MDNCTLDCIEIIGNFSTEGTCNFVQNNCIQDTVQIVQGYYCLTNASFFCLLIFTVPTYSSRPLSSFSPIILLTSRPMTIWHLVLKSSLSNSVTLGSFRYVLGTGGDHFLSFGEWGPRYHYCYSSWYEFIG